jgi:hypothetical protein
MSAVATDPSKAKALLANMTGTNAGCAECLNQTCARYAYRIGCLFRCQHQRENQCTNTSKIASLIPRVTLQDRQLLVSMIEQVSASCAYCILETVESVCGAGCVQETMHITTDYPILPRPCLPELAGVLKSQPPVPMLPDECSTPSRVIATAEAHGKVSIPASASPLDVACILAERFRRADSDARSSTTTLALAAGIGPITMLADLIVNAAETVRIEAAPGARTTLVVGERQFQVGTLALARRSQAILISFVTALVYDRMRTGRSAFYACAHVDSDRSAAAASSSSSASMWWTRRAALQSSARGKSS